MGPSVLVLVSSACTMCLNVPGNWSFLQLAAACAAFATILRANQVRLDSVLNQVNLASVGEALNLGSVPKCTR